MRDKLLEKLKLLKQIGPDKDWSRASLMAILAEKQARPVMWNQLLFRMSLVIGVFALAVISAQKLNVPMKIAGLDAGQLKAEAEEMELNLELARVAVGPGEGEDITTALTQTAESEPGHLNALILEKESRGIQFEEYNNNDIDEALKQLAD